MLLLGRRYVRLEAAALQLFLLHLLPLQLMSLLLQLFLLQLPFIDGRVDRAALLASVGGRHASD